MIKANNYAFIDSQNLNLGTSKDIYDKNNNLIYKGWKLDFKRFRVYLKDKYKVGKAFLFIGKMPDNENLYQKLEEDGYILIFKPILEINGKIKGNVDAELVLHTMIEFDNYDKAIVVSGDGDFHCLVEYLVEKKKFLHLMIPNDRGYSSLLKKFKDDYFVYLSGLRKKLEYK